MADLGRVLAWVRDGELLGWPAGLLGWLVLLVDLLLADHGMFGCGWLGLWLCCDFTVKIQVGEFRQLNVVIFANCGEIRHDAQIHDNSL